MIDLTNIRLESELTHLFIPMYNLLEVNWLFRQAGISAKECYVRPWRQVLNHQVPAIKSINDKQRNAEIEKYYGKKAANIKWAPAVIISHYNPDDLFEVLSDTLLGIGDEDYQKYNELQHHETNDDELPEDLGIHVMQRNI